MHYLSRAMVVSDSLGTSSCPQLHLLVQQTVPQKPQMQPHHIQVYVRQKITSGPAGTCRNAHLGDSWHFTDI